MRACTAALNAASSARYTPTGGDDEPATARRFSANSEVLPSASVDVGGDIVATAMPLTVTLKRAARAGQR